jgi:MYXO-CTERM domain-containing protein
MAKGRWQPSSVVALCVLGGLLSSGQASANGRFPRAQRLLEDARDADRLVLAATYGLLTTSDRGASWQHVCEAAYGERELSIDALTAFSHESALLAGIYSGVSRAERDACDFRRTLGRNNRQAVPDFALAASLPGRVFAIMVMLPEVGEPFSLLYRSDDDARAWQPHGGRLPEVMRTPLTIDVAPSDAERIYVSGLGVDDTGVLLRSKDGGQSFEALPIPTDGLGFEHPYIAAVDPNDPDQLYVRTDFWQYDPATGLQTARDALLYSDDGGESFSELARATGKLLGFAFSPDGSELLLGYGDPREAGGNRVTDPAALGIYRAAKGSSTFERRYAGSVGCLTWTQRGVYVCAHESEAGFSLGLIEQTDFRLASPPELEPLLVLADVTGPIECQACSAGAVCQNYWQSTCQGWGRSDCAELRAPVCHDAAEGGAGGQAHDVGAAGAGAASASGVPSSAGESSRELSGARGGCACRAGGEAENGPLPVLLALLARARRRKRFGAAAPA